VSAFAGDCNPSDPVTAIYDLGNGTYKTFEGGLYSGGSNDRPAAHESAGLLRAQSMMPLDTSGNPDDDGVIVLISIGFSNMTQEWAAGAVGEPASAALTFRAKALALQAAGQVNPQLRIIDGATGGATSNQWAVSPPNLMTNPWSVPMTRLQQAGLTRFQVQVACVKTTRGGPTECIAPDGSTLGNAGVLAGDYAGMARNLLTVFPNIKLVYFMPRTYGGYALTTLMPEPYAYESGFGIRWMIDAQISGSGAYGDLNYDISNGPVAAPWVAWGAYLWANGETPNGLGLSWSVDDFRPDDRTHPSGSGVDKAGSAILEFFMNDSTTQPWFCASACGDAIPAAGPWGIVVMSLAILLAGTIVVRREQA